MALFLVTPAHFYKTATCGTDPYTHCPPTTALDITGVINASFVADLPIVPFISTGAAALEHRVLVAHITL